MDPLTLALIFSGSALFKLIGATRRAKQAKGYQEKFEKGMQRAETNMRQQISDLDFEYKRLGEMVWGTGFNEGSSTNYGAPASSGASKALSGRPPEKDTKRWGRG